MLAKSLASNAPGLPFPDRGRKKTCLHTPAMEANVVSGVKGRDELAITSSFAFLFSVGSVQYAEPLWEEERGRETKQNKHETAKQ